MGSILGLFVSQYFSPAPRQPLTAEGLVVFLGHEPVDMDEKKKRFARFGRGISGARKA